MFACASIGFLFVLIALGVVFAGIWAIKKLHKQEEKKNA